MEEGIVEHISLQDFFYSLNAKNQKNEGRYLQSSVKKNKGVLELIKSHLVKLEDIEIIRMEREK